MRAATARRAMPGGGATWYLQSWVFLTGVANELGVDCIRFHEIAGAVTQALVELSCWGSWLRR